MVVGETKRESMVYWVLLIAGNNSGGILIIIMLRPSGLDGNWEREGGTDIVCREKGGN